LVGRLAKAGAEVTVLDLAANAPGTLLEQMRLGDRVIHWTMDICDLDGLRKTWKKRFDCVFHLAAQPISPLSRTAPIETMAINVDGTANILRRMRETDSPRMVFASSACRHGIPPHGTCPLRESDASWPGQYPYSESKRLAEGYIEASNSVKSRIARFGNLYGPGDRHFSRIVPRIIRQLLRAEPLRLSRGDGTAVLDFIYVDDAVDGLVGLARSFQNDRMSATYNFGTGQPLCIAALIEQISIAYDGHARRATVPDHPSEAPVEKHLDASKARQVLGWEPSTHRVDGIKRTVEWYRRNLNELHHLEDNDISALLEARPNIWAELSPAGAGVCR